MTASSARPSGPFRTLGSITVEFDGAERVLRLVGEIDVAVVQAFQAAHATTSGAVDVIDAGAVTFMNAAGLELMLRWKIESVAQGRPAVLRRSSRPVDRLLALTGFDFVSGRPRRPYGTAQRPSRIRHVQE